MNGLTKESNYKKLYDYVVDNLFTRDPLETPKGESLKCLFEEISYNFCTVCL